MKQTQIALFLWIGAVMLATQHAFAETARCAPHDVVMAQLEARYGETRQVIGLGADNMLVEVYGNRQTGSWTITITEANGVTCLAAAGEAFERLSEVLPPAGDPA